MDGLHPIIPGTRVGMSHGTMDGTVLGTGIHPGITGITILGTGGGDGLITALGITATGVRLIGDITMAGAIGAGTTAMPIGTSLIVLVEATSRVTTGLNIVPDWPTTVTDADA